MVHFDFGIFAVIQSILYLEISDRPLDRGVPCVDINDVGSLVDLIEERLFKR